MKIKDLLEAPLTDYEPLGDFTKSGPFRHTVDKKLVTHPKNQLKTAKFFSNSPYNFRLFFSNVSGTTGKDGKYKEHGEASLDLIREIFKQDANRIIADSSDAITVVFLGNYGDARVMLTPWIMAHRIGHAIQASNMRNNRNSSQWNYTANEFFDFIHNVLMNVYGTQSASFRGTGMKYDLQPKYNALFNAIGTQRSSRTGQIRRPYEFLYELFAQYIKDGKVTLNPLPKSVGYGKKAWGRPTQYLYARHATPEDLKSYSDDLADLMGDLFNDVLGDCVGKIYLM